MCVCVQVGYQMYNALYTFLPILWVTVFDRDVTEATSRKLPQLYHLGIRAHYFRVSVWGRWFAQGVLEAAAISFTCVLALGRADGCMHTHVHIQAYVAIAVPMRICRCMLALGKQMGSGEDPELFFVGAHTLTLFLDTSSTLPRHFLDTS